MVGANIASYVSMSSDNIIIGTMNGKEALGLYDRSYRLVVQPLSQLFAPISRVATPLLSRLIDNPAEYRRTYLDIYDLVLLSATPIILVCITNSDVVIHFLLGSRWDAAAPIFAWICVGGLASGINTSASWLFVSQGRTGAMAQYFAAAAAVHLSSFLLGSIFGIAWVAAISSISFVLITTPAVLWGATRGSAVRYRDLARITTLVAAEAIVTAGLLLLQRQLDWTGIGQLLVASVMAFGVFAIGAAFISSQRRLLSRMIRLSLATLKSRSRTASPRLVVDE